MTALSDQTSGYHTLSGMEILLLQDIVGIGKKNDLLVVGDGFALNYLLPNRHALVATPTVRKRYAEQIKRRAEEKERERMLAQNAAELLRGKSVNFTKKVTKTGKLYAGITAEQIALALRDQLGVELPVDAVDLPEHIKTVGAHAVSVKMAGQTLTVQVIVQAEK